MPLSRNSRDRRRRVLRENAETVATAKRPSQRRAPTKDSSEESLAPVRREPGYSQEVRRACQQRLVQLIPIRTGHYLLLIAGCLLLWGVLMVTHYLIHIRGWQGLNQYPLSISFNMRSPNSISHWLGTQLWMLTAVLGLLIYQIRKHRLDDYQASYRIWLLLIAVALFASFDNSSSILLQLGANLDGWAQANIGYSGWAVVFATFAMLIGMLALRLCTELKSCPMAVVFWFTGLIAWGISAMYGTGLLKSEYSAAQQGLIVGGCWLGGILSVFLAAGSYLRQIYAQAQRRFIERERLSRRTRIALPWARDANETDNADETPGLLGWMKRVGHRPDPARTEQGESQRLSQRTTSKKASQESNRDSDHENSSHDSVEARKGRKWWDWSKKSRVDREEEFDQTERQDSRRKTASDSSRQTGNGSQNTNRTQKSDQAFDESRDASAAVADEREGRRGGLRGWMSGRNREMDERSDSSDLSSTSKHEKRTVETAAEETQGTRRGWFGSKKRDTKVTDSNGDQAESQKGKRRFWQRKDSSDTDGSQSETSSSGATQSKSKSASWFRKGTPSDPSSQELTDDSRDPQPTGRRWFKRSNDGVTPSLKPARDEKQTHKEEDQGKKKRWFGLFDSFQLQPPVETNDTTDGAEKSKPIKLPSTRPESQTNGRQSEYSSDDTDELDERKLSKAERKRLRRERRNAA